MNLYRLTICKITSYLYEDTWYKWFLTEEMKTYKDKYEKEHRRENGDYIPFITDISYDSDSGQNDFVENNIKK